MELNSIDHPCLLADLLDRETQILYGSRFPNLETKLNRISRLANRYITLLTNVRFGSLLTDMETAYKMFFRKTLDGLRLRCVHFNFRPEIMP
jgi:hypothetical protein